jgi:hypothetical protein
MRLYCALDIDRLIGEAPEGPAVFAIFAREGEPYVARTTRLRTRLKRLLGEQARLFSLRAVAERVESVATASSLEAAIAYTQWMRRYGKTVRLRYPSYVRLLWGNEFPRTQVSGRVTGSVARYFGPFHTRAAAELFETQTLDLFQVRRCVEDLAPAPEHPGCIYGEMNLCARPCQQAVSADEYRHEFLRLSQFLATGGASLLTPLVHARDRASAELEFEQAARLQQRIANIEQVLKLRDELARDVEELSGVAVLPSVTPDHVRLQPMAAGWWQPAIEFPLAGEGVSMDTRLREALGGALVRGTVEERNDHVALLAHWFHSTSRDGEWFFQPLPYRKLVRAISSLSSRANFSSPPATV